MLVEHLGIKGTSVELRLQFEAADAKMFGTLTLIKRNGSEGSTMTMDSRETTIGRYAARALACRAPRAAHRRAARSNT